MPPKSKKCGKGIFDSLGSIGSSVGGLPDILKSPEMLATSLLATSPLAPITPLVSGYLFGKKLFGGSVFKDTALKKIAEQTGMTPEEIKLGYLMLKEVLGKIKEVHRDYGHYIPILKDRMKQIKVPDLLPSEISKIKEVVDDIKEEAPKALPKATVKTPEEKNREERLAKLLEFRKTLGKGSPELQELEGSGILSGLLSDIGLGKKKSKAKPKPKKSKKGGAFGPTDALSDLKDMASGYLSHETDRFLNEDVAPIINSLNPFKSGFGKKKKAPAKKGKGIISGLLEDIGLGKKKAPAKKAPAKKAPAKKAPKKGKGIFSDILGEVGL